MDTILAALEHHDRIFQVELFDSSHFHMGDVLKTMRRPFTALTGLDFQFLDETQLPPIIYLVIPDVYLGKSATRLRSLRLINITFPLSALRKLLLSATVLVKI